MVKKPIKLYIDEELLKKARDVGLNLSLFLTKRLEEYLTKLEDGRKITIQADENKENESPGRDLNPRPPAYKSPKTIKITEGTLSEFFNWLRFERGLRDKTIEHHMSWARRLYRYTKGYITRSKILKFFDAYRSKSKYTQLNLYKFLRVFFRDFLGDPDLITGIKVKWTLPPPKFTYITTEMVRKAFFELTEDWERAIYLIYATAGLRRSEALQLRLKHIIWDYNAIVMDYHRETKRTGITFFNEEAEYWLKRYIEQNEVKDRLFPVSDRQFRKFLAKIKKHSVSPQLLRKWHATELLSRGVPDTYVDIFQGRAPKSVLAKFYNTAGLEKLKEVYDRAGLRLGILPLKHM